MEITVLRDGLRPIMVVSHERSGTHFTMNALAKCFDYVSRPWIDLDTHQININYFAPSELSSTLRQLAAMRPAHVVKSHHEFRFFAEILDEVGRAFHLVYVYRHPADTLASYWKLLNAFPWSEGPKSVTALEFATSAPMARLMRYQFHQYGSMLDRWANHVRGWTEAAKTSPLIHLVRYENLHHDYETAVRDLGARLGMEPARIERPARDENVIGGPDMPFDPAPGADNRAMIGELALRTCPELLAELGYAPAVEPRLAS